MEILGEYLSVKWIQLNRPDYARVAQDIEVEFKQEIIKAHDEIMAMVRQTSVPEEQLVASQQTMMAPQQMTRQSVVSQQQMVPQQPMTNMQQPVMPT